MFVEQWIQSLNVLTCFAKSKLIFIIQFPRSPKLNPKKLLYCTRYCNKSEIPRKLPISVIRNCWVHVFCLPLPHGLSRGLSSGMKKYLLYSFHIWATNRHSYIFIWPFIKRTLNVRLSSHKIFLLDGQMCIQKAMNQKSSNNKLAIFIRSYADTYEKVIKWKGNLFYISDSCVTFLFSLGRIRY